MPAAIPAIIGVAGSLGAGAMAAGAQNRATDANQANFQQELGLLGPLAQSEQQLNAQRLALISAYAPQFQQMTQQVAPFYQQLLNLGSPYYAQRQRAAMEATARDYSSQAGQLQQQLALQGQGFAPSGTTAAALGGLSGMTGQTMSQNFLQNLFQNEATQQFGAQGLTGLASMYDPQGFLGNVPRSVSMPGMPSTQPNSGWAQGLTGATQALGNINWGGGNNMAGPSMSAIQALPLSTRNPFDFSTFGSFG